MMKKILRDESGVTAIEYGLIVSLIAVTLASAFLALGNGVGDQFDRIETEYSSVNN